MFGKVLAIVPILLSVILILTCQGAIPYGAILIACMLCFAASLVWIGRASNFLSLLIAWLSSGMIMVLVRRLIGVPPTAWRAELLTRLDFRVDYSLALIALSLMTAFLPLIRPMIRTENSNSRGSLILPITSVLLVIAMITFLGARDGGEKGDLIVVGLTSLFSCIVCIQVGKDKILNIVLLATISLAVLTAISFGFRYVAWYYFCAIALAVMSKNPSRGRLLFLSFFVFYPVFSAFTAAVRQLGFANVDTSAALEYWGAAEEIMTWQLHYFLHVQPSSIYHIGDMLISILPDSGNRNSAAVLSRALPSSVRYGGVLNIGAFIFAEGARIGAGIGVIVYPAVICIFIVFKRLIATPLLRASEASTPVLAVTWAYYGFTNGAKYYIFTVIVSVSIFVIEQVRSNAGWRSRRVSRRAQ